MNNERKWILRGGRVLNPAPFCLIGIVNVTPDSFSDGGKYIDPRNAVAHGLRLLDEGAGMLDLGAESTRPFAEPVPEGEEIARLMPVVARLREQRPDAVLSVDTLKAGTARDHTVAILKGLERFASLGRPLYVGLSRKSMFREILGLELEQRAEATRLAVALLAARGIPYHRVHDVAGCAQALRLVEAMTPLA